MNYTVYFNGNFSHAVDLVASTLQDAEEQAYQSLFQHLSVDNFEVDSVCVNEVPVYKSLKSFFAPKEESQQNYTSLNDFYTVDTADVTYTPLHS